MNRFLALFRKRQLDQALADEIRDHIELLEQDLLRSGLSPADARLEARRQFGGVLQTEEACRRQRSLPYLDILFQDLRHSFRNIARYPAFSAIVILTLALGIGINTAVFSVVNAVVLRPLPYPDPNTLVALIETEDHSRGAVSPANLLDYQRLNQTFSSIAGYSLQGVNLTEAGPPERLFAHRASSNFFSTLGVTPLLGRDFSPREDTAGSAPVVILSHELWQSRFAADPNILTRSIRLDGQPHQVIGVMPPAFLPPLQLGLPNPVSLYLPAAYPPDLLANHGDHEISAIARLKPGVSLSQAQSDLDRITAWLARTYPQTNSTVQALVNPLHPDLIRRVRLSLLILLAAVGLVWLVASVNVANLLLIRAFDRRREFAIRVAIGAGRARVAASFVVFSLVLSSAGCALGLLAGSAATRLLVRLAPLTIPRLHLVTVDSSVLTLMSALSLLTGLFLGLFPAWQISSSTAAVLKSSERSLSSRSVLRWRSVLTVTEIALSLTLLIGSGLLLRSFFLLNSVDLGFQPDHVLAVSINLPQIRYPDPASRFAFFENLESRAFALPGVASVATANRLPMRGGWTGGIQIDAPQAPNGLLQADVDLQAASPGYFTTLGVPISSGRTFSPSDRIDQPRVAIVNQTFARRFLADDPLGHRFRRRPGAPWITIVGVAADIRRDGRTEPINPGVYFPAAQYDTYPVPLADFAIRTRNDPLSLVPALQDAIWSIDKDQPLTNVKTFDQVISDSVAQRRFQTLLLLIFAAVALSLALIGVYGIVSYSVSQRTPEIGLRMALGAHPGNVIRMVLAQAARLILLGIAFGIAGASALSRYLASLLFAISPLDPLTFLAVPALLAVVAFVACMAPLRRAASIDPLNALRAD